MNHRHHPKKNVFIQVLTTKNIIKNIWGLVNKTAGVVPTHCECMCSVYSLIMTIFLNLKTWLIDGQHELFSNPPPKKNK